MTEREPEAWEHRHAGPYATLKRANGTVTIWAACGPDQHLVQATGRKDQTVTGHDAAHELADKIAKELD